MATSLSGYPGALDELIHPPTSPPTHEAFIDFLIDNKTINRLIDAVQDTQAELGVDPAGAAATVADRADAIETVTGVDLGVTVGAGATSVAETNPARTHTVVVTLTAETLTLANAGTGVGFGSLALVVLPTGSVYRVESVHVDLDAPASLTVIDGDDNGDFAVGTAATDGTLDGTDADIVASTALAYDTAVDTRDNTAVEVDATGGAVTLYFGATVDDADVGDLSVTPATADLTGTVTFVITDLS